MTLIEDLEREVKAETRDRLFTKSRELMRERTGMIHSDVAYEMAKQIHLPLMIKEKHDQAFKDGNFSLYLLMDRLFYNKDPAIKQAAAKELDDWINSLARKLDPSNTD